MYRPNNVPGDPKQIPAFLQQELINLQQALNAPVSFMSLQPLYVEPARLSEGMVVLADGVKWNPGSGSGFYGFRAGSWRFLG